MKPTGARKLSTVAISIALLLVALTRVGADETLIYTGDTISVASSFGPLGSYQEVYYAPNEAIEKIAEIDLRASQPTMTIQQASEAIRKKFDGDRAVVLESKLINLNWEAGKRTENFSSGKFFYFIKVLRPSEIGSYVVLFDGTVIEPREKKIEKPAVETGTVEQGGAGQPATRPESKLKGGGKP